MMFFCAGVLYICLAGLATVMWLRNHSRAQLATEAETSQAEAEASERGLLTQTDIENKYFKESREHTRNTSLYGLFCCEN